MIKKIILGLCLMGSFFIWYGCGGSVEAPEGSTITISPDSFTVNIDSLFPQVLNTQLFTISAQNPSGVPLKDIRLRITYPFAVPSPDELAFLQLFDNEMPMDSPMTVKTDENGVYILKVVYKSGGGLSYFGDIEVSSGVDGFASATFTVEAGSVTDDTEE